MKRLLITAVMVSAAMLTSSAQMFIGGSLGVDFMSNKMKEGNTTGKGPKTFVFEIAPKAGYYLSDKMAIGLELGLLRATTKSDVANPGGEGTVERKIFATGFGINAFGRYHLVEVDKFALILEGSLGFQTAKSKTKTGSTTVEGDPTNGIGLFVLPVLSYSLSDRLSLEANCDFLRFGVARITTKTKGEGNIPDSTDITNYFGLGVNSIDSPVYQELFATPFSVGVVWKF